MNIFLLVLGVLAGIMSGLFGIGGGVVIVPSLIMFFGMGIIQANATSLAALLLPVGILGVMQYYKAGLINIRVSVLITIGLLLGSGIGAEFAVHVQAKVLSFLYCAFLLYISYTFFEVKTWFKQKEKVEPKVRKEFKSIMPYLLVGFFAGIIAGLFGKGGGIVIVPILIGLFHYNAREATATSLAALQLPVGLPGVMVYAHNGVLSLLFAGLIGAGIVIGTFFGTKIAIQLPSKIFKRAYAVFLLAVAVFLIVK
ncbi:MAG: sulfite exporter TauE/SafE family protein [Bacteroidota bacterium]|nr:sulfite exporter TauE/SafE family protein [Bacteroidota bacterium]MDP4206986.1 sulfite exporter TauE/SafE family protein [Bacteroidota bacterium]